MPLALAFFIAVFAFKAAQADVPTNTQLINPPIRVRLKTSLETIDIDAVGMQIRGREKFIQSIALPQAEHWQIRQLLVHGKVLWQITRVNRGKVEVISDPILAIKASEIREQGKLLPSQIFFSPHSGLKFDVIGVLPLENYLVGVLASEMPLAWPMETLKAQAIAARSYALATMRERAQKDFHVESSVLDQVFSHIGSDVDESPLVAKANEAVRATEGFILISNRKQILKAFYHSDCGGKTANGPSVWGNGQQTGAAVDASCPNNPKAHWSLEVPEVTMGEKLRLFLQKPKLGNLVSLQLFRPSSKDRVDQVEALWESGEKTRIRAHAFRSSLGFDQFRSTLFEVQKNKNKYLFTGSGFGHGVGLCQWGARELGRQGQSFQQILSHYYSKAELQRLELKSDRESSVQIR